MANPVLLASIKSTNPMSDQTMSVLVVSDLTFLLPLRAVLARGGYSPKIWVGMCGARLENLALFQTKLCDFPIFPSIFRPVPNSILYFRAPLH